MKTSKSSDDELAQAYRESVRRPRWPGRDCPSAEALERLTLGEASAEEREQVADHLVECAQCAALVRDLRSLQRWAKGAEGRPRGSGRGWRWPVALAASALLTVGAVFLLQEATERPREVTRGPSMPLTPVSGAELARPPERFSWPDQPGATGYRLRLRDGRGELIWESAWGVETSRPTPEEVSAGMAAGAYTWTIEVRGAVSGSRMGPFVFGLAAGSGAER